jgi:hypothetical protein
MHARMCRILKMHSITALNSQYTPCRPRTPSVRTFFILLLSCSDDAIKPPDMGFPPVSEYEYSCFEFCKLVALNLAADMIYLLLHRLDTMTSLLLCY